MFSLDSKFPIGGKRRDLLERGAQSLGNTTYLILNVDGKNLIYEPNFPLRKEENSEEQYFSLRESCLMSSN